MNPESLVLSPSAGAIYNLFFFFILETGFLCSLEPVLELALLDQAGLELTEICLLLSLECWD